jgi:hypothetical protein
MKISYILRLTEKEIEKYNIDEYKSIFLDYI